MATEKVVVLNSGGLNSAVATSLAARDHSVFLLHARYGHRAQDRETELFNKQADAFNAKGRLVVEMPQFVAIGGNARVSRKKQIEDALALGEGASNCYVPGLILGLLSAAFDWATVIGASKVFVGISEDLGPPGPRTCSMYPDYARECVQLCGHLFEQASRGKLILLETPIIDLSRTEIIKLGHRLGAPFDLTWSCLSSGNEPCGGCVGCATRSRGFLDAAIPDPILMNPVVS